MLRSANAVKSTSKSVRHGLSIGASALALVVASTAQAQTAPPVDPAAPTKPVQSDAPAPLASSDQVPSDPGTDIVVTGIRQSLEKAQTIKRNADTVVDAISAEDIGALPDRSINEALQRVPGVAISRFAAPNDSQHFSVQGSGVTIRGLDGLTKSEFNGRDTFAVSGGREIGYNDVAAELAGSVEVFKNSSADLVEGGIAGTVSINTRKPFDSKERQIYLSTGVNYGDFEKHSEPSLVGLFSQQWDLKNGGRFGALVGGSYDNIRSRADSVFLSSFLPRFQAPDDGRDGYAPSDPTSANFANQPAADYQGTLFDGNLCDGNNPNEGKTINAGKPYAIKVCDNFPLPAGQSQVYTPSGAGVRTQDFNIKRKSFEGSLQYESPSRNLLLTAQYLRAEYTEQWTEHTIEPNVYYNDIGNTYPAGYINADGSFNPNGSGNYTFDENGVFTSGSIVHRGNGLAHNTPTQCTIPNGGFPYQSNYCPYTNFVNPGGINTDFSNRSFYTSSTTQDAAFNVKWEPTAKLHLNIDAQYVNSHSENVDDTVDIYTLSDVNIDLRGKYPAVTFTTPGFNTAQYFANPATQYFNDAQNNRAINDGHEYAFQLDAQYDLSDDGFLRKLRVGGRYSDREQTVRTNNYDNWGNLSQTWTDHGPSYLSSVPAAQTSEYVFDNFFRGQATAPPVATYITDAVLTNHDALTQLLRNARDTANCAQFQPSYTPLEDRNKPGSCGQAPQYSGDLIDGYFLPNEIDRNGEKTYAGYARLDFGTQEFAGGMKLSGNIGVRYVHTQDSSVGNITFPQSTTVLPSNYATFTDYCAAINKMNNPPAGTPNNSQPTSTTIPALCRPGVTAAQQQATLAFANGGSIPQTAVQRFGNVLPSLNVRLDITPKLLMRFAASEAISRPNFSDLQNYVILNFDSTGGAFTARASNPYLKPTKAKQFDLTAEWYFAKVGSLTGALFYKDLTDVILQNSPFNRTFSNGGQDLTLALNGPGNAPGHTRVKGLEIAYQQTFDFLPGVLSGFGLQGTFTYIDAGNVQIAPPNYSAPTVMLTGNGQQPPLDITGLYSNIPLPGLSKYNYNASAFFDKYGIYARVAYSWRSKFLLTPQDCCFPFLPVYQLSSGQVDASLFYTVDKSFKIGIQGSNLIDTTTKTVFLLNGDGLTAPRSFFKSDRQYELTVRLSF